MSPSSGIHGQLLEVNVVGCRNLRDTEWFTRQDPYVVIEYASTRLRTKTDTDGGKNPSFGEKFMIPLIEGLREFNVQVWNSNTLAQDAYIGTARVHIEKALSSGYDDNSWHLTNRHGKYAGELRLIMHFTKKESSLAPGPSSAPVPLAPAYAYAPPYSAYTAYSAYPPPPPPAPVLTGYPPYGNPYPTYAAYVPPPPAYPSQGCPPYYSGELYGGNEIGSQRGKIRKLDLSYNKIGDEGVKSLAEAFRSQRCKIRKLDLNSNGIGDAGANSLAEALESKACTIDELNLEYNMIGGDGVKRLVTAFKSQVDLCEIRNLRLRGNQIGDAGARSFAEALGSQEDVIDLTSNMIGVEGVKSLAEAFRRQRCKIGSLILSNNRIGDAGAKSLAEALGSQECTIDHLDLDGNQIGDAGANSLAEALVSRKCTIHKLLSLYSNMIGDDGAKNLCKALEIGTVQKLNLANNHIGKEAAKNVETLNFSYSEDYKCFLASAREMKMISPCNSEEPHTCGSFCCIVILKGRIDEIDINAKACLILFLADYAEQYVQSWRDFFCKELESKLEDAEAIGARLFKFLQMARKLCIRQVEVACSENVGEFLGGPNADELSKIIDDFRTNAQRMNRLLLECLIPSKKSPKLQLIRSLQQKVELDCSHLSNIIQEAYEDRNLHHLPIT